MLKNDKIILRPISRDDIEKIHTWQNAPDNYLNTLGIRFPVSKHLALEWIENVTSEKRNRNIYFGIELVEVMQLIGIISLIGIDWISKTCEFGIVIGDPDNRGKGYGKSAMDLIFEYAFEQLNIRKIVLRVVDYNDKALRLYLDYGFVEEGLLKEQIYYKNNFHDLHILSLFRK